MGEREREQQQLCHLFFKLCQTDSYDMNTDTYRWNDIVNI